MNQYNHLSSARSNLQAKPQTTHHHIILYSIEDNNKKISNNILYNIFLREKIIRKEFTIQMQKHSYTLIAEDQVFVFVL
jgi:hypothetical protein